MALPYSGQISMGDINVELGRVYTTYITLNAAENGFYGAINQTSASRPSASDPAAMSEWRGYNNSAGPTLVTINWSYNAPSCTGDYMELYSNFALQASAVGQNNGTFDVAAGAYIEVYVAAGFKGFSCDNASVQVWEGDSNIAFDSSPGYGGLAAVDFTPQGGYLYDVQGFLGFI